MANPWEEIRLCDYEAHMCSEEVYQLQAVNCLMADQLFAYNAETLMILGITGGNGLEYIHPGEFERIYGVDINQNYLTACEDRYPECREIFEPICTDIRDKATSLPYADYVIANLLIEYVGCDCFCRVIAQVSPEFVSCCLIENGDQNVVSDSKYANVFDRLDEVYFRIEENELTKKMEKIGYTNILREVKNLPNGKSLVRLDYHVSEARTRV